MSKIKADDIYLACASVCYRGYAEDEFKALLEYAAKAGYKYAQLQGGSFGQLEAEALKVRIEAHGLKGAVIAGGGFGGKDEEEIEIQTRTIIKSIQIAEVLGSKYLYSGPAHGCHSREPGNMERFVEGIKRVLELTPDSNMGFAFENHPNMILTYTKDYEKLLTTVDNPRVGMCLDVGHFHSFHQDAVPLIRSFGPRVFDVHLKDHIGTQSVSIGRGEIDLTAIMNALIEVGYKGSLTVELEVEDQENTLRYVREAYVYLKGMLGQKL